MILYFVFVLGIGATPAMIFVGIFMMPFYYGSRARGAAVRIMPRETPL